MARGGTHETSNISYVNVYQGKFRESFNVTENTPRAQMRTYTNKEGQSKEIWEIVDDWLSGWVVDVLFHDGNFGEEIHIKLYDSDEDKTVMIQTGLSNGYAKAILERLPSINFNQEVKLVPYDFMTDDGKRMIGMNVFQKATPADLEFSEKIDRFWGKDDLKGGRPEFPKNATKAKIKAYYALLDEFLVDYAKANVLMDIPKEPWNGLNVSSVADGMKELADAAKKKDSEDETDDLPF